jgi:hypothetical protein
MRLVVSRWSSFAAACACCALGAACDITDRQLPNADEETPGGPGDSPMNQGGAGGSGTNDGVSLGAGGGAELDGGENAAPAGGSGGGNAGGGSGGAAGSGNTTDAAPPEPEGVECPPIAASSDNDDQDLAIVRVTFNEAGSADVLIRNIGTGFISLGVDGISLCNGSDNCVPTAPGVSVTLLPGDAFTRTVPNTSPSGGELGLYVTDPFGLDKYGFLAWGSGAGANSLEALAAGDGTYWTQGARIEVAPEATGFVCTGDPRVAASFVSCDP